MARVFFRPHDLQRRALHQRQIAAEVGELANQLRFRFEGRELGAGDPDFNPRQFAERLAEAEKAIRAVASGLDEVAHNLDAESERVALAQAEELALQAAGSIKLADLLPADFPPAPTALLDDLAPDLSRVRGVSIAWSAQVGKALPPESIRVVAPADWSKMSYQTHSQGLTDQPRGPQPVRRRRFEPLHLEPGSLRVWGS